jgi:hypothetical protein
MRNTCKIEGCMKKVHGQGLCEMHYQRMWKHGDPLYEVQKYEVCTANGCTNKTRSPESPYCEMHYYRLRRNGTLEKVNVPHVLIHSRGYILTPSEKHPLVKRHNGVMEYEHRVIYYDVHGEGPFQCYWCGVAITWDTLHIDHLNNDKKDNNPDNLAASCPTCNMIRGRHKMVAKMREKCATWIEYKGQRRTLAEWADSLGISRQSLKWRLGNGWTIDRALEEPRVGSGPASRRKPFAVINAGKPIEMTPYVEGYAL